MADDKKKQDAKVDVRAQSANEVRVDANDKLSYKDYAAQFTKPVVAIQRIIERKGEPKHEKGKLWPNMEIKQVVLWGALPKEEPAKPERIGATVNSHIIHAAPPKKPPPKSIGSMEPNQ